MSLFHRGPDQHGVEDRFDGAIPDRHRPKCFGVAFPELAKNEKDEKDVESLPLWLRKLYLPGSVPLRVAMFHMDWTADPAAGVMVSRNRRGGTL